MSQRISNATRHGMGMLPELTRLRDAWRKARPSARRAFISEVLAPLVGDPSEQP
jgi:hypothetical protein